MVGNFGINLKKAGWDGIVIRGKSKKKVYIEIDNDVVKLKSAETIWGKDTQQLKSYCLKKGVGQ